MYENPVNTRRTANNTLRIIHPPIVFSNSVLDYVAGQLKSQAY